MNSTRPLRSGQTARLDGQAGSLLLSVLGVSLVLMLAGAALLVLARQSVHRMQRTVRQSQAQAAAEAGIADMVARLGTNYAQWQSASLSAAFGSNAAYTVFTAPQSNGNVLITSDGFFLGHSNRTIMELLGTVQSNWNSQYSLNSAILSGGDIRFITAAYTVEGDTHANQNATSASGAQNGSINGIVSASGTVDANLPGAGHSNGAPIAAVPGAGPFNFDSYRQLAISNGVYLEGDRTLSGTPLLSPAPANGILYVNGNLTIRGNSTYTGTIVANGDIIVDNHFTQTQANQLPSLLSTGNITLNNHEEFNGVMYAALNVTIQNHIVINGGVISGGYTELRNNVTINHADHYPAWDPLNPEVPPEVIVGGWLK